MVEAGNRVLQSLLSSLVLYYSLDEYRSVPGLADSGGIDRWLGTKGATRAPPEMRPAWHVPNDEEVAFANELLGLHLTGALRDLRAVVATGAAGKRSDVGLKFDTARLGRGGIIGEDVERSVLTARRTVAYVISAHGSLICLHSGSVETWKRLCFRSSALVTFLNFWRLLLNYERATFLKSGFVLSIMKQGLLHFISGLISHGVLMDVNAESDCRAQD